jgi:CBS domain-containing protein
MQLRDIMTKKVVTVSPEDKIAEAAARMREQNIGCVVVTNAGLIKGILTDRDIAVRCTSHSEDPRTCPVSHHMTTAVITATPTTDVLDAVRVMTDKQVKRLPVIESAQLVGLVSSSDLVHAIEPSIHDLLMGMGADRRVA